jgi:hypothetical protein
MRYGRRLERKAQSSALGIRPFGKGQVDRGQSEKR